MTKPKKAPKKTYTMDGLRNYIGLPKLAKGKSKYPLASRTFTESDWDNWVYTLVTHPLKGNPVSLSKDPPWLIVRNCKCPIEGYVELDKNMKLAYVENHKKKCGYYERD